MKTCTTLILVSLSILLFGQPYLHPSIGIGVLPDDDDLICEIPEYLGSFETSGLQAGDTIADFNLYDLQGNNYEISTIIQDEKPLLFISSSYTCPVFRGKVNLINALQNAYGNEVNIYIIYTVEAHPSGDISPYFGFENVGNQNTQQGILYNQPDTYGERKAIVADMLAAMTIDVPVLIDGLCNEWWAHFGPAPNNAYLVNPDGTVYAKHGWFDKFPNDIYCDIDNLLSGSNEDCNEQSGIGSFQFSLTGDSLVVGDAGQTLFVYGQLENNSADPVQIQVRRLQENIPDDWSSSMCLDACYGTDVDETTVELEPGEIQPYTMYFYTSDIPGEGNIRMGFRNLNNFNNSFAQFMYAETSTTSTSPLEANSTPVQVFPNPASDYLTFLLPEEMISQHSGLLQLNLYNLTGQLLCSDKIIDHQYRLNVQQVPAGVYFYKIESTGHHFHGGVITLQ